MSSGGEIPKQRTDELDLAVSVDYGFWLLGDSPQPEWQDKICLLPGGETPARTSTDTEPGSNDSSWD